MARTVQRFDTFTELAQAYRESERRAAQAQSREDIRRASNLRRSRALARNRAAGIGPRVAK